MEGIPFLVHLPWAFHFGSLPHVYSPCGRNSYFVRIFHHPLDLAPSPCLGQISLIVKDSFKFPCIPSTPRFGALHSARVQIHLSQGIHNFCILPRPLHFDALPSLRAKILPKEGIHHFVYFSWAYHFGALLHFWALYFTEEGIQHFFSPSMTLEFWHPSSMLDAILYWAWNSLFSHLSISIWDWRLGFFMGAIWHGWRNFTCLGFFMDLDEILNFPFQK